MSTTTSTQSRDALLNSIGAAARRLVRRLGPEVAISPDSPYPYARTMSLPTFTLPQAEPIAPLLIAVGLVDAVAAQLSDIFLRHASQLKVETERSARSTAQAYLVVDVRPQHDLQLELSSIYSVYRARYKHAIEQWTQDYIKRARAVRNQILDEQRWKHSKTVKSQVCGLTNTSDVPNR